MDAPGLHIVTLITDFGWHDVYVGQLKGILLKGCARILPVDLTHTIPPWDIAAAARCLYDSYSFFPPGTIHLVMVDPGVGSERRLLAAAGQAHYFVAPDNGILTYLLADNLISQARCLEISAKAAILSPTFHGRDILAPAVSRLAGGCPLEQLGPPLALHELVKFEESNATATISTGILAGQILSVDHFGNIRTSFHPQRDNISISHLSAVAIKNIMVTKQVQYYSEAPRDIPCFLIDSGGYIEIAINQANAAQTIQCMPGDPLCLHFKTTPP